MKKTLLFLSLAAPIAAPWSGLSPRATAQTAETPPALVPLNPTTTPATNGAAPTTGTAPIPPVAPATAAPATAAHAIAAPMVSSTTPNGTPPNGVTPPTDAGALDDATRLREATLAYNSGLAALKKSDWPLAAQSFGRAASLSPDDSGALSFLGYVRLQQKRWDDALNALLAAQENGKSLDDRTKSQLLNNIGFARWNKDQFPQAKEAFEAALALDPAYFDARYNLAFALLSRDQYAEALPHLRQLSVQNPKDGAIWDGTGEALEKTANLPGALGAYKKAVEADPKNESYRFKFALALVQSDRRADAIAQLQGLLALDSNNTAALLQLGDLHLKSNRWGDAAAVLKRYVTLKPDDFTGHFNLGVALDYSAKFDDALAQYAEAQRLRADDAATKNNVGRIYFKRDRLDEAIAQFNAALGIDPNFYDARTNLAIVLASQKNFEASNAQWQTLAVNAENASRVAPTVAQKSVLKTRMTTAYSGLANNALAQDKWKEAARYYRQLLLVSPADLEARSGLGRALYQDKDLAGAEATYREIIKLDPKNASAYNDLGVVLEARNDRKSALDAYSQALQLSPDHNEAKSNVARLKAESPVG